MSKFEEHTISPKHEYYSMKWVIKKAMFITSRIIYKTISLRLRWFIKIGIKITDSLYIISMHLWNNENNNRQIYFYSLNIRLLDISHNCDFANLLNSGSVPNYFIPRNSSPEELTIKIESIYSVNSWSTKTINISPYITIPKGILNINDEACDTTVSCLDYQENVHICVIVCNSSVLMKEINRGWNRGGFNLETSSKVAKSFVKYCYTEDVSLREFISPEAVNFLIRYEVCWRFKVFDEIAKTTDSTNALLNYLNYSFFNNSIEDRCIIVISANLDEIVKSEEWVKFSKTLKNVTHLLNKLTIHKQ